MSQSVKPTAPRDFSGRDAVRTCLGLVIVAGVAGGNWVLLPGAQALILPKAPGGMDGPWVIRPIVAFHFGATAVMTAVTVPFMLAPLQRKWKCEDAAAGTRYDPLRNRPLARSRIIVGGVLCLFVYGAGLLFYLFSWTTIGPEGIVEHLPWGTRHHAFQEIEFLENIPDGMRSDALRKNGPWFEINFRDGRDVELSLENEGLSHEDLAAVTTFIAARSGLEWERRMDARNR